MSSGKVKVYGWMLSYLKPYKGVLAMFVLGGFFVSAVELSIPKAIQYFIDVVLPSKDGVRFAGLLAAVAVLYVLTVVVTALNNRWRRILQEKPSMDMLQSLLQQQRRLGFAYYEQRPSGETLSLLREEANSVQAVYRQYVPGIVHESMMLLVSAALLLHTNVLLSLIVIPCFLSYYAIGPYFERKAILWGRESQQRRTEANRRLFDSVFGLLELRAFGARRWNLERLKQRFAEMHQAENTQHWFAYSRGTVRRVTTGVGAFAVFAFGFQFLQAGTLTLGEFIAFAMLYYRVVGNMTSLVTLTTEQGMIIVRAEKLFQFMKDSPDVRETAEPVALPTVRGRLSIRNVHFAYPGQPPIVKGFNLELLPSEKAALVGRSGNGKSTLVKLLGRFYDPTEGEIRLDGVPLTQLSLAQLRDSIGYVFQETYLFGRTVRDNIRFGDPEASDEAVEAAAKAAYAHEFIMELPQGYDSLVGERGIKLSGGQKQRIAIARLFLKNPPILVLDEATSALDNLSEHEVQKALDALMVNRTTVAVAHRLSTVRQYDKIVVVEDGRNAESGRYDELVQQGGRLYQLLEG